MNTKFLMTASAVVLGLAGVGGLFLPHELLLSIGVTPAGLLPTIIQILGALFLAFAMTNWMARESAIGGIYNRPLAVGNLTHFAVGAITFIKLLLAKNTAPLVIGAAVVYALFAAGFAAVTFGKGLRT